ncbi:MAG: hypothetical protein CVV64_09440 [Candidatus Wallbacteria bacterium HGW-Wallbacteria-1]|jgi:hypothetical protein|uniref:Phosphoesterase n=1 Tax=Candidatus Wallbacteria bacterium HGW-Wallbacteria-1 TaxID=2013854 RepID=A0A2N1PQF3_9BACT|nr:MAG: hypothetical protein CVV64_09440 [Candidatus Wallbacteria bacterium HGW-Wallbacteria-1]
MKIGVISDSHECRKSINAAVTLFNDSNCDAVLHCGDIISPIMTSSLSEIKGKFFAVFGNNDGERVLLSQKISLFGSIMNQPHSIEESGVRIHMTHEPFEPESIGASGKYDLVVFGHTHAPYLSISGRRVSEPLRGSDFVAGEVIVLNPGENCGFLTGKSSCAIVDYDRFRVDFHQL